MRTFFLLSLAAALVSGVAPTVALADNVGLEEIVVQMADTPEDHEALASYYRSKAGSLRDEAAMHRAMGKRYMSGNIANRSAMQKHCENIAEQNEKAAREYEALAKQHAAQAKQ